MSKLIDLTGKPFFYWTVIRRNGLDNQGKPMWLCRCRCSRHRTVCGSDLRLRKTRSCGCHQREKVTVHGGSHSSEYHIWSGMKRRCNNPKAPGYDRYGGAGVRVCRRWENSFANFLADMGPRPGPDFSIDRIRNSRGYTPNNCRWSDNKTQTRNRRCVKRYTYNGKTMCLHSWAEEVGVDPVCLIGRLKIGWTFKRAITTPPRKFTVFKYHGKTMTAAEWARHFGIPRHLLNGRLRRGIPFKDAIKTQSQRLKLFTFRQQSKTLRQWAIDYGIRREVLARRLKLGWTFYIALTHPVQAGQKVNNKYKNRRNLKHR